MVDPQADHVMPGGEVQNQGVGRAEDLLAVRPQRGQRVDIEEPAIVDLVAGHAPVGQPIGLGREQRVERVEAAGVSRCSVEAGQRCADRRLDLGLARRSGSASRRLMTSFSRCRSATRSGIGLACVRQVADRGQDALELEDGLMVGAELADDGLQGRLEDRPDSCAGRAGSGARDTARGTSRPRGRGGARPARAPRRRGRPGTAAGRCPGSRAATGADQSMSKKPA